MEKGFIKIWRKIKKNPIFQNNSLAVGFAVDLILLANWENKRWYDTTQKKEIIIRRGSFITSHITLKKKTGLSRQQQRTLMLKLSNIDFLTIHTTSRYTLISIVNYGRYQDKPTNRLTNQQPTGNQPATTTKEYKEYKEDISINNINIEINQIIKKFEEVYKFKLRKIESQRFTAYRLIKKYTLKKVLGMIEASYACIEEQYAPQILSIIDLEEKLPKLALFYKKNKKSKGKILKI